MATAKKAPARKPRKPKGPPPGTLGARQPVLKLEHKDGAHPFIWLLDNKLKRDHTKSDLARVLAVRPQSLYKWERACRANPDYPLPALRARQFATYFRVKPETFRPDFPWSGK